MIDLINDENNLSGNINEENILVGQLNPTSNNLSANLNVSSYIKTGDDGATFIPNIDEYGYLSWTNDKGLPNPTPVNIFGQDGKDGIDGLNGLDGTNGTNGSDGLNGEDGFTPTISISEYVPNVKYILKITNKDGEFLTPNLQGQAGSGGSGGGIEEAPVDGNQYGRQDLTWTKVIPFDDSDINATLENHNTRLTTNATNISNLQAEATAKWVLLNTVDNRSRQSATDIIDINENINNISESLSEIDNNINEHIDNKIVHINANERNIMVRDKGFFLRKDILEREHPKPNEGDFAHVGNSEIILKLNEDYTMSDDSEFTMYVNFKEPQQDHKTFTHNFYAQYNYEGYYYATWIRHIVVTEVAQTIYSENFPVDKPRYEDYPMEEIGVMNWRADIWYDKINNRIVIEMDEDYGDGWRVTDFSHYETDGINVGEFQNLTTYVAFNGKWNDTEEETIKRLDALENQLGDIETILIRINGVTWKDLEGLKWSDLK